MEKKNYNNLKLYSNRSPVVNVRAFWNPGVGLWQIDSHQDLRVLNRAPRADPAHAGSATAAVWVSTDSASDAPYLCNDF